MISTVFSRPVAYRAVRIVLCAAIGMTLALALGLSACGHATDGNTSAPSQQQATAEDQLQEQHQAQSKEQGQAQSREQSQSQSQGQIPWERVEVGYLEFEGTSPGALRCATADEVKVPTIAASTATLQN